MKEQTKYHKREVSCSTWAIDTSVPTILASPLFRFILTVPLCYGDYYPGWQMLNYYPAPRKCSAGHTITCNSNSAKLIDTFSLNISPNVFHSNSNKTDVMVYTKNVLGEMIFPEFSPSLSWPKSWMNSWSLKSNTWDKQDQLGHLC